MKRVFSVKVYFRKPAITQYSTVLYIFVTSDQNVGQIPGARKSPKKNLCTAKISPQGWAATGPQRHVALGRKAKSQKR